jgi:hypothetical protein
MKFIAKWKVKATRYGENRKEDQVDLSINEEAVQRSRVHKESQPLEQLDREIEEIRRLMLRSAQEAVNKGRLRKRNPGREARKQQQQPQGSGVDGQLQRIVWDLGGFQQRWEAHDQELMNFSQQWSMM